MNQFTRSLTEKLIIYSLGRALELADSPVIDDIMKNVSSNKDRFKALVRAVVLSESLAKNQNHFTSIATHHEPHAPSGFKTNRITFLACVIGASHRLRV